MEEVGYVEPKPGIPPDPSHLVRLIGVMKSDGVKELIVEDFYNKNTASLVAQKAGAVLLDLPSDVGATPQIKSWFDLAGTVVRRIAEAK
jgi:ABC-type Zn uptake system ZnuABC Zn-binding protein ZnuA